MGDPVFMEDGERQVVDSAKGKAKRFRVTPILKWFRRHLKIVILAAVLLAGVGVAASVYLSREAAWTRASDYFARAEYEKAEKELKGQPIPSTTERLRVYGQTMLATRNLDKSLEAYGRLYEKDKDPSVKLIIGNIYNEKKEYDKAIKTYQEVISSNPSNVQAYVNIATVYKLQGKTDDAIKIANKGVESNSSSVVLHELRVSMLMEDTSSDAYREAVDSLREINPNDQLLQILDEL